MTAKTKYWIAGAAAALVALPAAAWQADQATGMARTQVQAKVQERFARADLDKDGAITQGELAKARETMRATRMAKRAERRQATFAMLDTDRNGQLSPAEFAAPRARPDGKGAGDDMRGHHRGRGGHGMGMRGERGMGGDWLARADANKDGRLTLAEASAPVLARFDAADSNKDGKVTRAERAAAWASRVGRP